MAWAIPWLLAAFLPVLLTQRSTAQDDNLLINGGFEDGTAGWSAIGGDLTVDDALVRGESHAGVFATAQVRAEPRQCLPVAPSSDYEFWGYVARRQEDLKSSLRLRALWWDQDNCQGQRLWTHDSQVLTLDQEEHWYDLALGGRSPDAARSAYLTIEVQESGATVCLDDFVASGPAAPTETPTAEPSASATPTVTPRPPIPSPSATPHISPTASSWQMTPVPVQGALRNGGFEDVGTEGRPSFWRKYGGELARTSSEHFEGQFAAALSSQTSSTKWAYQIVTVQGGKAYVLSAYALKVNPAVAAAYLRLSWYVSPDGSGQAIDSADSTERLTDDSPEFRFLTTGAVVAPAEAASAKARLMLDPAGETPGTVYFDAVTFEETALPEPTPSPTATPRPVDHEQTPTPPSPTVTGSAVAPTSEPRRAPAPAGGATTPRPSPTGAGGAGKPTPAVLGAARGPVATATAAAATAATRVPASVFRQRKADSSVGSGAAARAESVGGGLSPQLLALAAGVPALAGAGAGVYYWRWRRARLR
jgi:hypothetical protein